MQAQSEKGKHLCIVLVLVLLLSMISCAKLTSSEMSSLDGWAIFHSQVRDVLVLNDGLILLSNSVPWLGAGTNDGKPYIIAFNSRTREVVWKLEYVPVAPIVANSQEMFVLENNQLVAIDLKKGNKKWSVPFSAVGFLQIFSDDDLVLIASDQALYAFKTQNGQLQWTSDAPVPLDMSVPDPTDFTSWRQHSAITKYGHVVYARKIIYQDSNKCQISVMALDAKNGEEIWQQAISLPRIAEGCLPGVLPLASNNTIVLIGVLNDSPNKCTLKALDINTGEIVWNYTDLENCSSNTSFVFLNKQIFAITSSDVLILDLQNGRLVSMQSRPLGGLHRLISTKGIIVARTSDLSQNKYQIMDLRDKKIYEYEIFLPIECNSLTEIAGITDEQLIFVNGNCIQAVAISEGKLIVR